MFYIVQMSDFHFGGIRNEAEPEAAIFTRMTNKILQVIPAHSTVVLCACGDYIDSKPTTDGATGRPITDDEAMSRYTEAKDVLTSTIITPLHDVYDLKIGMCIGNHDITHLEEVNRFSQELIGIPIDTPYPIHLDADNVDLVFINSCPPNDNNHGEIDYIKLEKTLKSLDTTSAKYLVMHHTLMSMDERDKSPIRQAPRLIQLIDQYSIKAILHGHTHGQYLIRVGTAGCPIIGVGTIYVRNYPNVNSQFNIISCSGGIPISADNYQYHADLAANPDSDGFEKIPRPISKENNFFYGRKFSKVYDELLEKVQAESKLYHVHLHVNSSFNEFQKDVRDNFGNRTELETLDKKYSYTELAEMWEASKVNTDVLYFNHGMYFNSSMHSPSGIDYINRELGKKTTSSRAVLVTVNAKEISETAPDALLPSLLSIQVGFDKGQTTLHISMTLRALEANRFLKINICEILLIAQRIRKKHSFTNIEAEISAFRVQAKKDFGCFLRAKLDMQNTQYEIANKLSCLCYSDDPAKIKASIARITDLIRDKRQRSETVIETAGIEHLLGSVTTVMTDLKDGTYKTKLYEIHTCITLLLGMLDQLKQHRKTTSEQNQDMDNLENDIQNQYDLLIQSFERLTES